MVTGVADIVAIAHHVAFWWGDLALWIPALASILLLVGLNFPSVKAFGETELWFSLIKIVAIVALIIMGLVMILTGFEHTGTQAAFSNLWDNGGWFPTGAAGFIAGFQIAVFAFVGIELGEPPRPRRPIQLSRCPKPLIRFRSVYCSSM